MSDQVRIGVVGTSGFTDFMHLTNLKSDPRVHVGAICGRNHERVAEVAARHEIPLLYTDYHEMLAEVPLDAVVVAVPDDLHFSMVMDALDAGLHVLCEKPLASNANEARAMYEKAEAAGLRHMVYFTWSWLSHHQQLARLLKEGYIGQPLHCSLQYLSDYGFDNQYNWRWDAERANGVLGDLGSHAIQFARLYVGEIARVSADLHAFVERHDDQGRPIRAANDSAILAVEFVNGAHGTIQVGAVSHLANQFFTQRISLGGDAGTIHSEVTLAGSSLRGARNGAESFEDFGTLSYGPDDDFGGIFDVFRTESVGDRLFVDAVLESKVVSPDFHDGWRVQQVIDAALASHLERRWVMVPEFESAHSR